MINTAQDSDGNTFEIWKQDQMNSCGVASTWMARGLVRQMSYSEDEWTLAQRVYRHAVNNSLAPLGVASPYPQTLNPAAFRKDQLTMANAISRFGFYAAQLANAITAEGMRCDHVVFAPNATRVIEVHRLADRKPAIALIYWSGGGGHFIVAARQTQTGNIVYLDPWSGDINEQPNDGAYVATYGSIGALGEVLYLS